MSEVERMMNRFLKAIGALVIVLFIIAVVLIVLVRSGILLCEFGVSFFNLLVDIVVGFFTVWGLLWAGSQFAEARVKPELRLIIGRVVPDHEGMVPLADASDELVGWEDSTPVGRVSGVIIGLFLENTRPKAAQYVRVVLRVRDVPRPKVFRAVTRSPWDPDDPFETFKYEPRVNTVQGEAVFLQFGQDLVIYEGEGVYLGNIYVGWPGGTRPEGITFAARLYSLEGEPKSFTVSHPIRWIDV
ncbi:MAG: hypothetical protein HWN68_19755 [Desulfobacterales bacterium]|nr:hypothetical protein [Desulfobacterales bacterium]